MDTPDVLKMHSQLGADGWRLLDFPANDDDQERHPENAVGLYQRGDCKAWLLWDGKGFRLEGAEP